MVEHVTQDIDNLYDAVPMAIATENWVELADLCDRMRNWCLSDDALQYARSSVELVRNYANMLTLTYGHKASDPL